MSENIATFIYQTANPIIKDLAKSQGHQAYINSFKAKQSIPEWKDKFERLMNNYQGEKFTFRELESIYNDLDNIQMRYRDIIIALYDSLKPHYMRIHH